MVGKKVGIQATGVILLRALLAKNKIPEKDVTIVTIGADMSPLLTGQVDVRDRLADQHHGAEGARHERVDLRLWDAGVRLYALPYYATQQTIKTQGRHAAEIRAGERQGLGLRPRQSRQGGGATWSRSFPTSSRPTSARRWT